MSPYTPQQQQLQPSVEMPQHIAAHPQMQQLLQQQFEQEMLQEVLRAICHVVAREMDSPLLDKLASLPGYHPELLRALRQWNDSNESKIQRREHLQKAPAAPNAPRPVMPNGKIDRDLEAARAVAKIFNTIPKGGR